MGGKPNAVRKLRRSRRLAGLGPSTARPVNRPRVPPQTRRRRRPAGTVGIPSGGYETPGTVDDAPVKRPSLGHCGTVSPVIEGEGSGVIRCQGADSMAPSTSKSPAVGGRGSDSEGGSSSAGRSRPGSRSSTRNKSVREKNSLKRPSTQSETELSGGRGTSAKSDSFQSEFSSSLSPGVSQSHPTESTEEGKTVAGGAEVDVPTPSTSTEQRGAREPVATRRPAQEFAPTFAEHFGGVPTQGESFCCCPKRAHCKDLQCTCGEEDNNFEWTWDCDCKSSATEVSESGREARFHINYSSGTAAVRGSEPMTDGQYFWEIKMITPVYGTDMMVGVGTANVDLDAFQYNFCSLLGRDGESWGLSYYGKSQHKGQFTNIYGARFGQGSIIGMHLDMWQGTLSYYKNRQPLGIIFSGLRGKILYPMVSSTAARTGMRLVKACSYATSLEFLCCKVLRKMVPLHLDVTTALSMPPGLHEFFIVNNLFWLLRSNKFSIPNMEAGKKRPYPFSEESEELRSETECSTKRTRML